MKRNRSPEPRGLGGMSRRIGRAPTPLRRQQRGPILSLLSDDEDESGTEPGDHFDDIFIDERRDSAEPREVINIDDEDEDIIEMAGEIDAAGIERSITPGHEQHNDILPPGHREIDFATTPFGSLARRGDSFEVDRDPETGMYTAYIYVRFIRQDERGKPYFQGFLMQRCGDVDKKEIAKGLHAGELHTSLMPRNVNTLCALLSIPKGTPNPSLRSAGERRYISEVGVQRKVIFTNQNSDQLNGLCFGETQGLEQAKRRELGILFCRRIHIQEYDTVTRRRVADEFLNRELNESECDVTYAVAAALLFNAHQKRITIWNGQRISAEPPDAKEETIMIPDGNGGELELVQKTAPGYMGADLCAGAGGAASGAEAAGIRTKYLLELDSCKCETLRLNFGHDVVIQMDISKFAAYDTVGKTLGDKVDTLHISYPCQGFSSANTHKNLGKDDTNIFIGYSLLDILRKCRPRILTMEQVPGIMHEDEGSHFRWQIHNIISQGYSVRWRQCDLTALGLPAVRKRIIVMAAAPGHIIPDWPPATHGDGPGLKPFATVADVLAQIPRNVPEHMLQHTALSGPHYPWDPNVTVSRTMTTGGVSGKAKTSLHHPTEPRGFNLIELAGLQGFSPEHQFVGSLRVDQRGNFTNLQSMTEIKKQIGNAFPKMCMEQFAKSGVKAMQEMDAKIEQWKEDEARRKAREARIIAKRNGEAAKNPIVLE
ncbi:hypothetical protein TI39_contig70g00005 [Zymoseptoria brevis]|uniref:DNA (cytosine-5-)-methyltransferase n=1 Tax=Zymoseptoria brevis TaxID=1047168 RepID=A0A0F4GYD3_9PEZI|nr:hypothetical protein TI39_contig70g00005 [Zymoseptoria brevis]